MIGRFLPGKPAIGEVFVRGDAHGNWGRYLQRENVLDVVRHARRVAVPPLGEDLEGVGDLPVLDLAMAGEDARFFLDFAAGGFDELFAVFLAAGSACADAKK